MTTISKEKKFITLINVFTVDPAKQQQLVDLLIQATEKFDSPYTRLHFRQPPSQP
jgi:hypothetical protein